MAIDKAKQVARWKRNKRSERLREKAARPARPSFDPNFETAVWNEAEKRVRNFPWSMYDLKPKRFYPHQTPETSYPFICDVWAVITLLESQNTIRPIPTRLISSFLWETGRTYGVKRDSLRTKIARARKIIDHLEASPARDFRGAYWPKFPESVAEHGSGLKQHVTLVLRNLAIE